MSLAMHVADYGMIALDSEAGRVIGFTSDRFSSASYLWKDGGRVLISMIAALTPGKGAFRELVRRIEAEGLQVAVLTPLAQMQAILARWGFVPHLEMDAHMGDMVDVWERPA